MPKKTDRTPKSPAFLEAARAFYADAFEHRRKKDLAAAMEEWTDLVISQLHANAERGAVSTMIIHPITLYLCDRFRSFERILDVLARAETLFVSEVPASTAASEAA